MCYSGDLLGGSCHGEIYWIQYSILLARGMGDDVTSTHLYLTVIQRTVRALYNLLNLKPLAHSLSLSSSLTLVLSLFFVDKWIIYSNYYENKSIRRGWAWRTFSILSLDCLCVTIRLVCKPGKQQGAETQHNCSTVSCSYNGDEKNTQITWVWLN